ncbi:MAG TPA: siderophore-interacting protein [Steroidobacteraceae bacterium]
MSDGIDTHLLIGDETALPAIARRLQELPQSARALVVVELGEQSARPRLRSAANLQIVWVPRDESGAPQDALIGALWSLKIPTARCFAWVAHRSQVARAIRQYLERRGLDMPSIKPAGYRQSQSSMLAGTLPP